MHQLHKGLKSEISNRSVPPKVCLTTSPSLSARKEWRLWTVHVEASSTRQLSSGRWSPDSAEEQGSMFLSRQDKLDRSGLFLPRNRTEVGSIAHLHLTLCFFWYLIAAGASKGPFIGRAPQCDQLSAPWSQYKGGTGSLWGGHCSSDGGHGEGEEAGWSSEFCL